MQENHRRIVALYSEGYSMRQVAERVGVSLERVRQILVRENVPRRPKHVTRYATNYAGRQTEPS